MLADDRDRENASGQPSVEVRCYLGDAVQCVFEKPDGDNVKIGVLADEPNRGGIIADVGPYEIADCCPDDCCIPCKDEDGPCAVNEREEYGEGEHLGVVEEYEGECSKLADCVACGGAAVDCLEGCRLLLEQDGNCVCRQHHIPQDT